LSDRLRPPHRLTARRVAIYVLPALATVGWLAWVLLAGHEERVADHWRAALTMVFGSFIGGSTPLGGGAVAFPVFTKLLDVSAPVARSFSLAIQAVGLGAAAVTILLARRPIEGRAVVVGLSAAAVGFVATQLLAADGGTPFWSPTIPAAYEKVTFTLLLAAMSYIVLLSLRSDERAMERVPVWNVRVFCGLCIAGLLGGVVSLLIGTGANLLIFFFLVVLCGLHPRIGVPTAVVTMAGVSVLGLAMLGVADGQLDIGLAATGEVVSVGGATVDALPGRQFDLFGLWLASVPVVVWGAPLGTWFVSVLCEDRLVAFVGVMAAVEVVTTVIFLDELYEDPALIAYAVFGLVLSIGGVRLLARHRHGLLGLPVTLGEPSEGGAV
jgi:uncharacterized membrane protein YfcA